MPNILNYNKLSKRLSIYLTKSTTLIIPILLQRLNHKTTPPRGTCITGAGYRVESIMFSQTDANHAWRFVS